MDESGQEISDSQRVVDTDKESVRAVRAMNQFEFYFNEPGHRPVLSDTIGKPALERFFMVRDALFPQEEFPNLHYEGARPAQLVSRRDDSWGSSFARLDVAPSLQADLFKLMDWASDHLTDMKEQEREPAALRLASVLYVLGIMIHPAVNGNAQTHKCMITSYLHEFSNKYKKRFFPVKFSDSFGRSQAQEIMSNFHEAIAKIDGPPLEVKSDEDQELLDLASKIRHLEEKAVNYAGDDWQEVETKTTEEVVDLVKDYSKNLSMSDLVKELDEDLELQLSLITVCRTALDNIVKIFIGKGYDEDLAKRAMYQYSIYSNSFPRGNVTHALLALFSTDAQILREYIESGEVSAKAVVDDHLVRVLQGVIPEFEKVALEIDKILTNKDVSSIEALNQQYNRTKRYRVLAQRFNSLTRTKTIGWNEAIKIHIGTLKYQKEHGPDAALDFLESQFDSVEKA